MNDPIAMYLADIYTVMANLVGCPAISLPLFPPQQQYALRSAGYGKPF